MVKILPINDITYGMRLAQNIYRHDSLLALAKGSRIKDLELNILKNYNYDFVLVEEHNPNYIETLEETLEIIHSAYKQNTIWTESFGDWLYLQIEKMIKKNKTIQKYLIELRKLDSYSFAQCVNISIITTGILAIEDKVDKELVRIAFLSMLHDVGRIKMGDLMSKEGKFTDDEFRKLQKHPIESFKMLQKAGFADYEIKFVLETHERFDGAGYPYRLKGDEIGDMAQIVFIADVYNGMSSYRPHREALSPFEVIEVIEEQVGVMFSKRVVDIFIARFTPHRIGTMVELDNGSTAIVKKIAEKKRTLPIVDIISDLTGQVQMTVGLARRRDIRIQKIIQAY